MGIIFIGLVIIIRWHKFRLMKEIDRKIEPKDLIEGNIPLLDVIPVLNTSPRNFPQTLFETYRILEHLRIRYEARKNKH